MSDTAVVMKRNISAKKRTLIYDIVVWVLRIVLGFVFVFPLLWAFSTSIKPMNEIVSKNITLWVQNPTFEHYQYVFSYTTPYGANAFLVALADTSFLTFVGMVLNITLCTAAAYAFAKLKFFGHKVIFRVFLSSMMIPGIVTLVPTFVVIRILNLWGSMFGIILPGAMSVFNIFFMRQFFVGQPDVLGESAEIDGANQFQIFIHIYLPLVKAPIATLAIFSFQGGWNNFLMPYVILSDRKLVISTFIRTFPSDNFALAMAASMVATLPVLVLFVFFQKYFMNAVTFTGIKG